MNEAEAMARLSSDNPKARWHNETRRDGRSAWACIPVVDAVEVRTAAIAAEPIRDALEELLRAAEHTHEMDCVTAALDAGIARAREVLDLGPKLRADGLRCPANWRCVLPRPGQIGYDGRGYDNERECDADVAAHYREPAIPRAAVRPNPEPLDTAFQPPPSAPRVGFIQYARIEHAADGNWYAICPECGLRIRLIDRKDAESFTKREYVEHFASMHAGLMVP